MSPPPNGSRCTDESHRAARWLWTLSPSTCEELRLKATNEVGTWLDCVYCGSTLLIAAPPPVEEASLALGVRL